MNNHFFPTKCSNAKLATKAVTMTMDTLLCTQPEEVPDCRDEVPVQQELTQEDQVDDEKDNQRQVEQESKSIGWEQSQVHLKIAEQPVVEQQGYCDHHQNHEDCEGGGRVHSYFWGTCVDDRWRKIGNWAIVIGDLCFWDRGTEVHPDVGYCGLECFNCGIGDENFQLVEIRIWLNCAWVSQVDSASPRFIFTIVNNLDWLGKFIIFWVDKSEGEVFRIEALFPEFHLIEGKSTFAWISMLED